MNTFRDIVLRLTTAIDATYAAEEAHGIPSELHDAGEAAKAFLRDHPVPVSRCKNPTACAADRVCLYECYKDDRPKEGL